MDAPRVIVTAHDGSTIGDLDPSRLVDLIIVDEVNGERSMTVTTTEELSKGDRLLWRDGTLAWREYVVESDDAQHTGGTEAMHTYWCPWSLQYDLSRTFVSAMPGTGGTPATARQALDAALGGTDRWEVGAVQPTTTGSASFFRMSGWEAMQELVKVWGGEVSASVTVGLDGVTARSVNLLDHIGSTDPTRRFDYGGDVVGIKRTVLDELWTARVVPLGAAIETDAGGYGRKLTIEDVNDGILWVEDADAVPLTRVPNGNGGWEVPVQVVENDSIQDPTALKAWAIANLYEWTQPKVSYETDVAQLALAGMDAHGVGVGDECVIVDSTFGSSPIRIKTRLLRMEEHPLDPTANKLTFSNLVDTLGSQLDDIARSVANVQSQVTNLSINQSTAQYVSNLLKRINAEANATGGYMYITEGQGVRTYDVAVTDPLVGAEASSVVEMKGGTIRIANTKDSAGNWEWKTIFTSGYVNAEVIRAIGILSGSHVEVDATGVHIYDPDGTEVAEFGELGGTGSPTARLGANGDVHLEVTSGGLEIDNEAGDRIFHVDSGVSGITTMTTTATLTTFSDVSDVSTTSYSVSDARAVAGDVLVTATVGDTDYTLDAAYVTAAVTAGVGVTVALTSDGVAYVQQLMSGSDGGEGSPVASPCELSVEWQRGITDVARLTFDGEQVVDGAGRAIVLENNQWSNDSQTEAMFSAQNTVTGKGVTFGVGSGGENRGVFDTVNGQWIIYRNANGDTIINGPHFSVNAYGNVTMRGTNPTIVRRCASWLGQIGQAVPTSGNVAMTSQLDYDSAGNNVLYSQVMKTPSDDLYRSMVLHRKDSSDADVQHGFYMHIGADGKPLLSFTSNPNRPVRAAWHQAISGWTQLAQATGGTAMTYDLTDYSEVMFTAICTHAVSGVQVYAGSVTLPVGHLDATTQREVYLSGAYSAMSSGSVAGRGFAIKATRTTATAVIALVDGTSYMSSTVWRVLAR